MSLRVLHSHTGTTYRTNIDSYSSLEDFRSWISRKSSIQPQHQILLTSKGKPVKFQNLSAELEVYLYDRSVLGSTSSASKILPVNDDAFTPFQAPSAPIAARDSTSVRSLQNTCGDRSKWAKGILTGALETAEQIKRLESAQRVINQGTSIAVNNAQQHLDSLAPKYEETRAWAEQTSSDQNSLLVRWQPFYTQLAEIKVETGFCHCLKEGEIALARAERRGHPGQPTLQDYVDRGELSQIDAAATLATDAFATKLESLVTAYTTLQREAENVLDAYTQAISTLESGFVDSVDQLVDEIDVLAKKISTDHQAMSNLGEDQKSLIQATRISQMHSDNFIPSIESSSHEIKELGLQLQKQKRKSIQDSTFYLQKISNIESQASQIHAMLAKLDVDPQDVELYNILDFVLKLPTTFGLYLIEYIKRVEWAQKASTQAPGIKQGSALSATHEAKRRAQRAKSMDNAMIYTELGNIGLSNDIELNSSARGTSFGKREDINDLLKQLLPVDAFGEAVEEIQTAVKELDEISKPQSKIPKVFKNGSIHEAALGRESTQLQSSTHTPDELQKEKAKAEEKLKSAESRIRKLEDLLHRQSVARPPSSTGYSLNHAPSFERQVTSPITNFTSALSKARDTGSRRSSTSSRRVSQNLDPEERSLAQRIIALESELTSQREISKELKKDAKSRSNAEQTLKAQVKEAIATKEDLFGNMEAQQLEFENERRLLKDENMSLKMRLEELEDEIDHLLNNNEQDQKVQVLHDEIERLRSHAHELETARRDDLRLHNEQISNFEKGALEKTHRNSELEGAVNELNDRLGSYEDAHKQHIGSARSSINHLIVDPKIPDDNKELFQMLERAAEAAANEQTVMRKMMESLRTDNASLETRFKSRASEIDYLREELQCHQTRANTLDDQIMTKTTEFSALQSQLEEVMGEKEVLQSMFKSSETEVETLKRQFASTDTNHKELETKFATLQGFHADLDDQLRERNEEIATLQEQNHQALIHHTQQGDRADEVSKQLALQIESLKKVLELVGLTITYPDGPDSQMEIHKAPKSSTPTSATNPTNAGAASTTLDPSASLLRRSISGALPTQSTLEALLATDSETNTPSYKWATTPDPSLSTTLFQSFSTRNLTTFNISTYCTAILKRIKDVEHIARKWQREAKLSREKHLASKSLAHERIALRNFKEGDLALFLPTRDQVKRPWAAFNVGAPHYFLREREGHRLGRRDWLIARIGKVEERVVDLSGRLRSASAGSVSGGDGQVKTVAAAGDETVDDENPYELSDGLRWYLVDAVEEKPGAGPISVGTGKATVAMSSGADVVVTAEPVKITMNGKSVDRNGGDASKNLARSLDSRRSSTTSRKSWIGGQQQQQQGGGGMAGGLEGMLKRADSSASRNTAERASLEGREQQQTQQQQDRGGGVEPTRMQEIQPGEVGKERNSYTTSSPSKRGTGSRARSPVKAAPSPEKKAGTPAKGKWDSLLSLDYNIESGGNGR